MAKAGGLLSHSANLRWKGHQPVRVCTFRPSKAADGTAHCQRWPAAPSCLPGTTELHPDDSDLIDLSEFGLEGMARVGPSEPPGKDVLAARLRIRRQGHCYGCGVRLQTEEGSAIGYVEPEKFNLKRIHRQTDKILCVRCTDLCNGKMVPAVEDFAQRGPVGEAAEALTLMGKTLISPEDLRRQLLEVGSKKALVLMLVDLLDVSGTMMSKVRDLIGRNPIILIGTKMDLLPSGCHPKAVTQWLLDAAMRKRLNVVSAHLVSSHTMEGISAVASKACAERKGRDVYVIGAANVGKSAFVRAFLREMRSFESRNFDAAALGSGKYLPVESAMPGTTLGLIPLQAFASGGTLYDSPGVHLHHRIPHMLSPDELKLLHPRKRLCMYRPPSPADIMAELPEEEETESSSKPKSVSATYQWSDLVRVDVLEAPPSLTLVFQGPHSMKVTHGPLTDEPPRHDIFTQNAKSVPAGRGQRAVLSCAASVALRGGLVSHTLQVATAGGAEQAVADIAISGLPGWVTLWASHSREEIKLRVWAVRGVEVFVRPPFPTQLPEQLLDELSNTTGSSKGRGPPGSATDDTNARVKQIFRRFQVAEVPDESGPNATELLEMLKKEVADLEEVDSSKEAAKNDAFLPPTSTARMPARSTPRSTPRSSGLDELDEVDTSYREARHRTGGQTSTAKQNVQELSALFGAALEDSAGPAGKLDDDDDDARSLQANDYSTARSSNTVSSSGNSTRPSARGQTRRSASDSWAGADQTSTRSNAARSTRRQTLQGVPETSSSQRGDYDQGSEVDGSRDEADLAELFGAALDESGTSTSFSSDVQHGRADVRPGRAQGALSGDYAASAGRQTVKNRSRARQVADDEAKKRELYDRPRLFTDDSLVSEPKPRPSTQVASGVNISDLAAKYSVLSQSVVEVDSAGGEGVESEAVVEETFVLDEDMIKEIAAQASAEKSSRRRRRV